MCTHCTVDNSPVCTLQGTSLTHLQYNCINVKITKQNAAIEYMQKVTVAESKAIIEDTFEKNGLSKKLSTFKNKQHY